MPYLKGKEDMGLEDSLKLLDLPSDATIDDANQAYANLHRMINRFHQEAEAGDRGERQEDMDILTSAYEKAVAYLSDRGAQNGKTLSIAQARSDLHFTSNVSAEADKDPSSADIPSAPVANARTVEDAIAITSQRMRQTESLLADAQQAVRSATAAVDAAKRRYGRAKQASLTAVVAASSGKNRALLLEIEAKRVMQDAIAVAEKARNRIVAARQAARDAATKADEARDQASCVKKSEETAAAEMVCAEDRLEKETYRLKALTHTLVEARSQMRLFQNATSATEKQHADADVLPEVISDACYYSTQAVGGKAAAREQIMSDLLEIEASLAARKRDSMPAYVDETALTSAVGSKAERRRHHRIAYPVDRCPLLSIAGREIPILDLSTAGMRLESDAAMAVSRIVRGSITFSSRSPIKVTGKVVRQDDDGLGLKLVTRIGDHILDQERLRLMA
jgi:hypothetical protein